MIRILFLTDSRQDGLAFESAVKACHPASTIAHCHRAEDAIQELERGGSCFDLVVANHHLDGVPGLAFCKDLLAQNIVLPLMLITDIEPVAIEAMQNGVEVFLVKDRQNPYSRRLPYRLDSVLSKHREQQLRIQTENALVVSQKTLAETQQAADIGHWRWDLLTDQLIWSDHMFEIFGFQAGEYLPTYDFFLRCVHPEDKAFVHKASQDAVDGHKPYETTFRIFTKDGVERIVRSKGDILMGEGDQPGWMSGTLQDVTDRKRLGLCMTIAEKIYETMIEGVLMTNRDGVIHFVNPALTTMSEYPPEELIGSRPSKLLSSLHEEGFYGALWDGLIETGYWQGEVWNRRKSGGIYPVRLTIHAIADAQEGSTQYIALYYDITDMKQHEIEVHYQECHDVLTGLPNRQLFYDRLMYTLSRAKRDHHAVALMFLDLDDLKHINNKMGHPTGDVLLQNAAARLKACARMGDTVSRLGGDEFAVILHKIDHNQAAAASAERIVDTLSKPFWYKNEAIYSSVSVGIALYPEDGETAETLLKHSEAAMFHAKETGKNRVFFFSKSVNEASEKRADLEDALRKAICDEEMEAYYQPIYSLQNSHVVGMEALVRWRRSEGRVVLPAEFIPLAEEKGFVVDIDKLMIQKACAFIKRIRGAPDDHQPQPENISVNLSAVDFGSLNVYKHLTETVEAFGIRPGNIGVEITESALIKDIGSAVHHLKKLRDKGFSVSIDDFGMGYSSLSYLAKLPIDILKIDRSFVTNLPSDKSNNAIAKAIVIMAHELDIKVIAEGVETENQLRFLRSIGCDQIQGYLYSLPLPEEKVEELLVNSKIMNKFDLS